MRIICGTLLVLLTSGCVSRPLGKVDTILEHRIAQMEISVAKVKTEAIEQAKTAANEIVVSASKEAAKTGKELVDHAADRVEKIVDKALKEDVPVAVTQAVVGAADKVAERMGLAKETSKGQNGEDLTYWVLGSGGVLGGLFSIAKSLWRRWNQKKTEDEDEDWVHEVVEKKLAALKDKPTA